MDAARNPWPRRFVELGHETLALGIAVRQFRDAQYQPGNPVLMHVGERVVQALPGLQAGVEKAEGKPQHQCCGHTYDLITRAGRPRPCKSGGDGHRP
ncbi:hypothetical protein D3C87_1099180 [compost metagenome]